MMKLFPKIVLFCVIAAAPVLVGHSGVVAETNSADSHDSDSECIERTVVGEKACKVPCSGRQERKASQVAKLKALQSAILGFCADLKDCAVRNVMVRSKILVKDKEIVGQSMVYKIALQAEVCFPQIREVID